MERGTLVRWNDEKGFGFIKPETGNDKDVFIHISTLKHMARKPMIGDEILFHRENQPDGKVKAVKASIEGIAVVSNTIRTTSHATKHNRNNQSYNHSHNHQQHHSRSRVNRIILIMIILGLAFSGFKQYQQMNTTPVLTNKDVEQMNVTPTVSKPNVIIQQSQFQCEAGKTHCSQMRSCAEATYYIRHCPGTEMDGDGDGVPCERQFCN
ncbi:excalibur calcium-binding domain-containing protein [Shewanella livingstonensis]|nr:excalibur calcium-binding domain-containing protein [Shewanella livingstonensis]